MKNTLPMPLNPEHWRRIAGLAAVIFVIQLAGLWLLSEPAGHTGWTPGPEHRVMLASVGPVGGPGAVSGSSLDPTVFALPGMQGFSGPAWLTPKSPAFTPATLSEPPKLLDPPAGWGADLADYLRAIGREPTTGVRLAEPQLVPLTVPSPVLATGSAIRIEGALKARGVRSLPAVPEIPSATPLADTAVEIVVNGEGVVMTARLVSSPARPTPEQQRAAATAMKLARQVIFQATKPGSQPPAGAFGSLESGRLVFQWQTVPPVAAQP